MLSDDVYEKLKRMKRRGESFSDVISRLLKKPKLLDVAGSMTVKKEDWETVKVRFQVQKDLDEIRRRYLLELISQ